MKKENVSLRISSQLINQIKNDLNKYIIAGHKLPKTFTNGICVRRALDYAILHCVNHKKRTTKPSDTLAYDRQDNNERDVRLSMKASQDEIDILVKYYGTDVISEAIRCAVIDAVNENNRNSELAPSEKLSYLVGQKNNEMCDFLNKSFESVTNGNPIDYFEPFTGTANVCLHSLSPMNNIRLNELNPLRYNLLRVIRNYPDELKVEILKHEPSKSYFDECRKKLDNPDYKTKRARIETAAMYYFLCNCSAYGKCESYKSNITAINYMKRVDALSVIHSKLAQATITKYDALNILKKFDTIKDSLIYIDPPYIFSEDYYKNKNTMDKCFNSHTRLRNLLEKLKDNNTVFISYRITVSSTMRKKGFTDTALKKKLDSLYLNRGYYINFKDLKRTNKQCEILISSKYFDGSIPYDTAL